jgi:hypothetical protein
MLAFLDTLIAALVARDVSTLGRLLAHPLMDALPDDVRDEARALADGQRTAAAAPLHAMRYAHMLSHLLGVVGDPAARRELPADPLRLVLSPAIDGSVRPMRRTPTVSPQMDLGLGSPRQRVSA